MGRAAGQFAQSAIPFSSALRFGNPDPNLRDARDVVDSVMATVPGLSAGLPARRDMWGDPLTVHKGLWVVGKGGLVDAEVRRMADEAGVPLGGPPSASAEGGVDLRDITMADGRNAYDVYQDLARQPSPRAKPIKDVVAGIMLSPAYQKAPDGPADLRGTKAWIVSGPISKYREAAMRQMKANPNVRAAMLERTTAVADHYRAQRAGAGATGGNAGAEAIKKLGDAFGVDLTKTLH